MQASSPYHKLNPDRSEIRLLIVQNGQFDDPVSCRLKHIGLEEHDALPYETISYCWGDSAFKSSISVDGAEVTIPASAEQAIRRIRLPDADRTIWLDSVCIDQSNLAERAEQVAKMDEVYSCGQQNIIWLGADDEAAQAALDALKSVRKEIQKETRGVATLADAVFDADRSTYVFATTGLEDSSSLGALQRFLDLPWFERLWVVQEAALSPASVCYLGPHEFRLEEFLIVAVWLQHKRFCLPPEWLSVYNNSICCASSIADFVSKEVGIFHIKAREQPAPVGIAYLLRYLRHFKAADPKDHVYGTLGLIRRWGSSSDEARNLAARLLKPDYTRPLAQVFRDATRFAIRVDNNLRILYDAYHRIHDREEQSFPSWVPLFHREWNPMLDTFDLPAFHHADCSTQAETHEPNPNEEDILLIEGILVNGIAEDSVAQCSDVFTVDGAVDDFLAGILEMVSVSSSNHTITDVGVTLRAGRNVERSPITAVDAEEVHAYREYVEHEQSAPPSLASLETSSEGHNDTAKAAARFVDVVAWESKHRRFFVMGSGFIGIGPQTMRTGDVVAILYGAQWPFVLRPCGENFQLIGMCYVHGIMNGEYVLEHRKSCRQNMVMRIQ